jgi:hypothetical protein
MRPAAAALVLLAPALAAAHVGGNASVAQPLNPTGACEPADASYVVHWMDNDARVTVPAFISWSYADRRPPPYWPGTPPVGLVGTQIAKGIDERDTGNTLVWDTSQVPAGAYHLWSLADDPPFLMVTFAKGVVVVAHEGDPVWPSLEMTAPGDAIDPAGASYEVRFDACDPDGTAQVTLAETPRFDGEELVTIGTVPAAAGSFTWDVSAECPGIRYLHATITDGRGLSFSTWARSGVSIAHGDDYDLEAHGCFQGAGGSGGGGGSGDGPAPQPVPGRSPKRGACGGGSDAAMLALGLRKKRAATR